MAEYIVCRNCDSPDCKGCNLKNLETMLNSGKFDCLMNENRCVNPSEDVAPVRHGRWDDEHKCTVCHNEAFFIISNIRPDYDYDWEENLVETGNYIWDTEWIETDYCHNCGSKMDLDGE